MAKRLLDLLLAGCGLIVLSPVLLAIALAIRLDSPGPVFFRQVRVGRHGREFRIHKFRTMTHAPQDRGPQLTVGQDARITRVGALLRRTKLDELAQLIDVLEGTMSLVGPRPEVPRYVALYPAGLREKVLSVFRHLDLESAVPLLNGGVIGVSRGFLDRGGSVGTPAEVQIGGASGRRSRAGRAALRPVGDLRRDRRGTRSAGARPNARTRIKDGP